MPWSHTQGSPNIHIIVHHGSLLPMLHRPRSFSNNVLLLAISVFTVNNNNNIRCNEKNKEPVLKPWTQECESPSIHTKLTIYVITLEFLETQWSWWVDLNCNYKLKFVKNCWKINEIAFALKLSVHCGHWAIALLKLAALECYRNIRLMIKEYGNFIKRKTL